jgi:hypothetical protein
MPSDPKELLEYKTDHDLLIELRTELRGMRTDIQSLNDGTSKRLDKVESRQDAQQEQISSLKQTRAIAYAYAALITLILIPIVSAYIQAGKI